jgi:O-antigen ligase
VRTGIVLTYLSIFVMVFFLLLRFKKPVFAGALAVCMLASALFAYQQIPTVRHKIAYTFYGLTQYKSGQDSTNQVSDARRILSDQIGIELIQQHPFSGVGFGDVQDAMNQIYAQRYPRFPQDVYAHIHNQYVYVFTGAGILLGILFITALFAVLIQFWKEDNTLFVILYLMLLLVMLWEPFIENQLGTSIFLFICSLGMLNKTRHA